MKRKWLCARERGGVTRRGCGEKASCEPAHLRPARHHLSNRASPQLTSMVLSYGCRHDATYVSSSSTGCDGSDT